MTFDFRLMKYQTPKTEIFSYDPAVMAGIGSGGYQEQALAPMRW